MRVVGRRVSSHLGLANAGNRVLGCRVSSDLGWADPAQPRVVGHHECYQVLAMKVKTMKVQWAAVHLRKTMEVQWAAVPMCSGPRPAPRRAERA